MKKTYFILGLIIILALVAFFLFTRHFTPTPMPTSGLPTSTLTTTTITIGSTHVVADVANTQTAREQGLSGRTSLADGTGMLFVFEKPNTYGFWMKDMNFAIDIIFLDSDKKVIAIAPDASPSSYNSADPNDSKVFYPTSPALYVLEVPAGFAAKHSIKIGDSLL